jgi:hypothetical protein
MLKRIDPYKLDEKQIELGELANWAWDSHSWVEYYPGYYKCEWCQRQHTSVQSVSKEYPLCLLNPCIMAIMK